MRRGSFASSAAIDRAVAEARAAAEGEAGVNAEAAAAVARRTAAEESFIYLLFQVTEIMNPGVIGCRHLKRSVFLGFARRRRGGA